MITIKAIPHKAKMSGIALILFNLGLPRCLTRQAAIAACHLEWGMYPLPNEKMIFTAKFSFAEVKTENILPSVTILHPMQKNVNEPQKLFHQVYAEYSPYTPSLPLYCSFQTVCPRLYTVFRSVHMHSNLYYCVHDRKDELLPDTDLSNEQ